MCVGQEEFGARRVIVFGVLTYGHCFTRRKVDALIPHWLESGVDILFPMYIIYLNLWRWL